MQYLFLHLVFNVMFTISEIAINVDAFKDPRHHLVENLHF